MAWAMWPSQAPEPAPKAAAPVSTTVSSANTMPTQSVDEAEFHRESPEAEAAPVEREDEPNATASESTPQKATAKPKKRRATTPEPEGKTLTMADEVALVARAKAELSRGDFADALATTKEHAKNFPAGRLKDEGKLLRVRALCGVGKTKQARKEIDRFLERKPNSALSDAMSRACP